MSRKIVPFVLLLFGCAAFYAYADNSDMDRILCNGEVKCMQEMKLAKISERLSSVNEDVQMANNDLKLMCQYDGVWDANTEARDWYQGKRGVVCAANDKTRREIPKAKSDLLVLLGSQYPGISARAERKLRDIQNNPLIKVYLSEAPCQQAKTHCQHFGCTEIIEGSL